MLSFFKFKTRQEKLNNLPWSVSSQGFCKDLIEGSVKPRVMIISGREVTNEEDRHYADLAANFKALVLQANPKRGEKVNPFQVTQARRGINHLWEKYFLQFNVDLYKVIQK